MTNTVQSGAQAAFMSLQAARPAQHRASPPAPHASAWIDLAKSPSNEVKQAGSPLFVGGQVLTYATAAFPGLDFVLFMAVCWKGSLGWPKHHKRLCS